MKQERIAWLDTARFFGIFAIFFGHLGVGRGFLFVFIYHVPLFFFISGCTENFNKETSFFNNLKKKFISIIIPFLFFALLSIVIIALDADSSIVEVRQWLILLLKGAVRNTFIIAGQLWFFTALFVVEVMFSLIKKVKYKTLMLLIAAFFYAIYVKYFADAYPNPALFWNIDSAVRYLLFYTIGYISFESISKLFADAPTLSDKTAHTRVTRNKNAIIAFTGTIAILYTIAVYFDKNYLVSLGIPWPFSNIFTVLIIIYANLVLSYYCRNIGFMKSLGKNTLYLCGNEKIMYVIIANISIFFWLPSNF